MGEDDERLVGPWDGGIHAWDEALMRTFLAQPSRLSLRTLACTAFAIFVAACSTSELTFGGPLDLQISSNSPVSVSDSLQVDYDIVGRSLLGMVVEWGDAEVDSVGFAGAQTAGGRRRHLYATAGSYTVTATVVDQLQGEQTKELTVTIDP